MDNKITIKVKKAMEELDRIADTYGVARATHITMLASHLMELNEMVCKQNKELEDLRKFKEEHSEHDDKRNEVSTES